MITRRSAWFRPSTKSGRAARPSSSLGRDSRHDGPVDPGLKGKTVVQVRVGYQLVLVLDPTAEVTIETEAWLTPGGPRKAAIRLDPEHQDVAPALALVGATITSAEAAQSGALHLTFSTGVELCVNPHPGYEAWQVSEPSGVLTVCGPGGELAIWR